MDDYWKELFFAQIRDSTTSSVLVHTPGKFLGRFRLVLLLDNDSPISLSDGWQLVKPGQCRLAIYVDGGYVSAIWFTLKANTTYVFSLGKENGRVDMGVKHIQKPKVLGTTPEDVQFMVISRPNNGF